MDQLDRRIIATLQHNARESTSNPRHCLLRYV